MLTLPRIASLFASHGTAYYGGEAISQTAHALQCAQLAEQAGEPEPLIVAAFLHDVGHLMLAESSTTDMRHQEAAADALAELFGPDVTEPIRLHVAAKRYLCAVDAGYFSTLSEASVHSLALQGGPFDAAQASAFAAGSHADAAVRLRRYDDLAKVVDLVTPPVTHYMHMAARCLRAA
ncbi:MULTISPECIES: phosphonate degradation HD-domain oxygenase [Cupriavidus]|uniref:HD domain-containing protein n=1 Tax=Cupriavidus pinatubonensis (strain JMP 134 / LMG 1197) TaxID=264198 RepID=Q46TK1_CUPPJ|nr:MULTISPECIES: phosphonate degradation HD-domain oxygenase [Cupriavidus]QYY28750.1 HD domain-containing protein [Cupriavidus pinatubonensis]TPQ35851.1 HD domain-containing protein [Cupriavidus pinatubonensis]